MKNLIAFLVRHNHWFVFVILEVISLVLLFRYNNYQGSVWFTSANEVTGKVYEWESAARSFFSLREVNENLTARNAYLERQLALLTTRNGKRDSSLLRGTQMELLSEYRIIPAKVVDNSVNKRDNLITIDKGSADGIHPDMGVVSGTGVVGIVFLVSPHYSIVIPVLNSNSNISCAIQNQGYFGYLHWDGGAANVAYVDDIPRHAKLYKYAHIVTSGYSSVFPPGISVGKVVAASNSANGLSYRLHVKLSTDFGNLRDVCVIDDSKMNERLKLIRMAEDSIKSRSINN
ncbi:MAG: rod shape-determining protein MreC [Prevotella sp.]|nr:rod shape-determining protein MreC [Prevotella sp.]